MKRAAVLIGVDKSGKLPKLRDAARGARLMEGWCKAQGMATTLITDEGGAVVTLQQIKQAIFPLAKAGNIGQLIVYFAGHGVSLQRQEYWLLTDAPDDSQAAVNVATSATFAATCGIGHVVLISDACRTAPEGIQAQSVRGGEIFPNAELDTKPVDQFFACQLGKPSAEVRDPAVSASEFKALYTSELVPALQGKHTKIIEWKDAPALRGHVHLRPLRDHLSAAVAERIAELDLQSKLIQVPVATISSDPPLWISELAGPAPSAGTVGPSVPQPAAPASTPERATSELLRDALAGADALGLGSPNAGPASPAANPVTPLVRDAWRLAQPFGPTHHETQCGFKLRGAVVVDFIAANAHVEFAGGLSRGGDLRVTNPRAPAANVLLVLESGEGVLLPAIPDFICALSFENGELIDVSYEPSTNSRRWRDYEQRANEIRALRAIAASASANGSFRLEGNDALAVARRMQVSKGVDPSLAVYAAYAYHELQRRDLLTQMADFMSGDLGAPLFDVALLARKLDKKETARDGVRLVGAVPLMAQGWTLLNALEVKLPDSLSALQECRAQSLWTLFDAQGVDRVRRAFAQGDLP